MFNISRRKRCTNVKDVWQVFWNYSCWIDYLIGPERRFGFGRGCSCTGFGCGLLFLLLFVAIAISIFTNTNWLHLSYINALEFFWVGSFQSRRFLRTPVAAQGVTSPVISSPSSNQALQGPVAIVGTTDIPNFASAELDFSYISDGTNTKFPIQIMTEPIQNNLLATWDTTINKRWRLFIIIACFSNGRYVSRCVYQCSDLELFRATQHLCLLLLQLNSRYKSQLRS